MTGGLGFIGSNFVENLLLNEDKVNKVCIYDNFTYAANINNLDHLQQDSRLEIIKGDICDFEKLNSCVKGYDLVLNFAAESHVDRSISNASAFIETNVVGVSNVLEVCRLNKVKRLVQISTDEVYGSVVNGESTEESNLSPNSPYSASKAAADLLVRSYVITHGIDAVITRSSNNFGKYQHSEKFVPVVINAILTESPIPVYGAGSNIREWISVIQNCRAIMFALHKGVAGEIYNIGSGHRLTNLELIREISQKLGVLNPKIKLVEDRKGHDFRYAISNSKLESLGFVFQNDFEKSLGETLNWFRGQI